MTDRPRPVRIADLLWLTATAAFFIAVALPAYRFAFDFNSRVSGLDYSWLGPVGVLATIGVLAVPALLIVIGSLVLRSNGSVVTLLMGMVLIVNSVPAGFACASIGRACAYQMAG